MNGLDSLKHRHLAAKVGRQVRWTCAYVYKPLYIVLQNGDFIRNNKTSPDASYYTKVTDCVIFPQ